MGQSYEKQRNDHTGLVYAWTNYSFYAFWIGQIEELVKAYLEKGLERFKIVHEY